MCNNKLEINDAEKIILQGLKLLDEKNYSEAAEIINKAYETFKQENYLEGISISLSLIAFLKYTENEYDYEQSIALAKDGNYMAQRANSITANLINEVVFGNINFSENNKDIALIHYNNALKLTVEEDKYAL